MTYHYQQYIGGEWVEASNGATWEVLNPATEEGVQTVPFGNGDDCNAAIEAAHRAFPSWSGWTPYRRADLLKQAADLMRQRLNDLAHTTVLESGKPFAQARGEWGVAADLFEWFAEEGKRAYGRVIPSRRTDRRSLVLKQPLGVVGVITAWNFPAYNPARAWAAALAAGCTVVGRASEYTPLTAMEMVNILAEAGLPAGVMNLINGGPEAMGQAMLNHPACRKISFTGSTRVGRILMDGASRTHTRLSLEMGGNAPVLIFPDVNLETLATSAVQAKFRNGGQVCIAPQRYLVHSRIVEEFVERVAPIVGGLKVGSGLDKEVEVGPLINARQRERVEAIVSESVAMGAQVAVGGQRPPRFERGYFYQPTVLLNVQPEHRVFAEEVFGPVMPILPFADLDEALHLANSTPYGLAAYVWTNDLNTAVRAYEGLEFGMVGVNDWAPHATEAPFPGWKQSGLGIEAGQEGLHEYLETKLVALGNIRG
jgi:acyl-CoA reductase-like NAD-dependent aldehyde dehydrogenase